MAADSKRAQAALKKLHKAAAHLPEITERLSHGTPTLFVRDKKVLVSLWDNHHDDGEFALWCPAPAGVQAELVEREPDRFFVPAYVGHRGWVGVRLDVDPDWDEISAMLTEAFRMVAPKTLVKQIDAE